MKLTDFEMNMLRQIRRDYAQATRALQDHRTLDNQKAYERVKQRRDRAIRSLAEDGFTPREIAAILMCSKNYVRDALEYV